MQENRPAVYFSCTLGARARFKSIYEKKLMAVLKWRHYLLGRKFVVRTDQKSFKYISDSEHRLIGHDYQHWVSKLLGFDFEILYKTPSGGLQHHRGKLLEGRHEEEHCQPPQDRQSEVVNPCLKKYLHGNRIHGQNGWHGNTLLHTSIKCTPFKALYERDPPTLLRYEGQQTAVDAIDQLLGDRDVVIDEMMKAQQRMQNQANKKRKDTKTAHGTSLRVTEIPQLSTELELEVQPEALKGIWSKKGGRPQEFEVMIKWQGMNEANSTWEGPREDEGTVSPDFNLEDKVRVLAAGDDRPQPLSVYSRRHKQTKT
ncbi:hypothetical protein LXL04_008142 [Taraxacum kok-saghyz]